MCSSDLEHELLNWLHPIIEFGPGPESRGIGEAVITGTTADNNKIALLLVAIGCSLLGVIVGWLVYQKRKIRPFEPALLRNGWHYDDAISWFMGNPGRAAFQEIADEDQKVIDGAVNGVATVVRVSASETRKAQTGYVRQYAGVIGIGVVLLLGWFVVIRGIL